MTTKRLGRPGLATPIAIVGVEEASGSDKSEAATNYVGTTATAVNDQSRTSTAIAVRKDICS